MSDPTLIGRGQLGRGLSVFGAAVISWSEIAQYINGHIGPWVLACALVANVAWILLIFLAPTARVGAWACMTLTVVGGALTAAAVDGSSLVPAAVTVLWLTRDIRYPSWRGLILAVVTMVLVVVGDVFAPVTLLGLVALEAGVVVGFLAGLSRRQFVLADLRSHELVEEHARAEVLSARTQLASEIHDVLAHSLGGLVIQLDAVDALLESGDAAAAAVKVRDARALAADGLGEARRAVAALSESPVDATARVPATQVVADVSALVTAHDSLGGTAELRQSGEGHDVSKPVELALRRAVQEGLTNARKHAPGQRVEVALTWTADSVELRITNRMGDRAPGPGGGHGLIGMRDRFAALPGGSATTDSEGKNFVVTVRASTA
jgi:signal transduction histidine kinase